MLDLMVSIKALPLFAACVRSAASYPPIPSDKTTPVQQRLAVNGPNGTSTSVPLTMLNRLTVNSCVGRLEHLPKARATVRGIRNFKHFVDVQAMFNQLQHIPYFAHIF